MNELVNLLSAESVWGILSRFCVNIIFLTILIGFIYFRNSKKENFLFTFFMMGITVFFISSIMRRVELGVGLAFGLFAIFGILRLRTRNFSVKDMAYLFSTIGLAVINSMGMVALSLTGVLIINAIIVLASFILERFTNSNLFSKHTIKYDNLELLSPENRQNLLQDISKRIGQRVLKVKIRNIDFKKESAELDIFYKE